MKILLINPPGDTSFVAPPLGLAYLASTIKEKGYQVIIKDYLLEKFNQDDFLDFIKKEKISLIGLTAVTPNISNALLVAELIKKEMPETIIVLGGPHATLQARETLEQSKYIDFIVRGEGEFTFTDLIEYIISQKNLSEIKGLTFRKNGQIIETPAAEFIQDLNNLPYPARELLAIKDYSEYLPCREKPATTIFTSRGCPFHCIFCSKPIGGNKPRYRSPENILAEIKLLKRDYNVKEIIFYDDTFTLNRQRIIDLCQLIIKENLKINWKCETRVNLVDKELLETMKKAGCYLISYGFESGNQRILNILKKGTTLEQIKKAVYLTREAGIEILGYFMLGIPGETKKEIEQTIDLAKNLNLDYVQFSIATAYPGTELYQIVQRQGKLSKNFLAGFYALGQQKGIVSLCDIDPKVLQRYLKRAYWSFYFRLTYIWQRIANIKSLNDLKYNLKGLKTLLRI